MTFVTTKKRAIYPRANRVNDSKKDQSRRGLTFVELILVVAIIAVVSAVTLPQFRATFENLELENNVKDIYYLSRYLQSSAITHSRVYYLSIDKDSGKVKARYKAGNEWKDIEGALSRRVVVPKDTDILIEPPEKDSREAGIYFYPDGSIENISLTFKNKNEKKVVIQSSAGEVKIR